MSAIAGIIRCSELNLRAPGCSVLKLLVDPGDGARSCVNGSPTAIDHSEVLRICIGDVCCNSLSAASIVVSDFESIRTILHEIKLVGT